MTLTSLTASDVAVTLFPVVDVDVASENKALYTTGVARGSGGSLATAAAVVNEALFQYNVFRFQASPELRYVWEGPEVPQAVVVSQAALHNLLTRLMNAGAHPEGGKWFKLPVATSAIAQEAFWPGCIHFETL